MTDRINGPSDPMYRLFRKMDGELIIQYFVPSKVNDDFSMVGRWKNVETVNEGQNGISSSNAS
jgi:hypothetical protein